MIQFITQDETTLGEKKEILRLNFFAGGKNRRASKNRAKCEIDLPFQLMMGC